MWHLASHKVTNRHTKCSCSDLRSQTTATIPPTNYSVDVGGLFHDAPSLTTNPTPRQTDFLYGLPCELWLKLNVLGGDWSELSSRCWTSKILSTPDGTSYLGEHCFQRIFLLTTLSKTKYTSVVKSDFGPL